MQGKLTRLGSTNDNLRTSTIEGSFQELPEVGKTFEMLAASLTPGHTCRYIGTSPVVTVGNEDGKFLFTTQNSFYRLEITEQDTAS